MTTIAQSAKGVGSVRTLFLHRDTVTGVDRAFVTIGTLGVFSGVWDAASFTIAWGAESESGPVNHTAQHHSHSTASLPSFKMVPHIPS